MEPPPAPPLPDERPATTARTLFDGTTFVVADPTGDLRPGTADGLYLRDHRILAGLVVRLDGEPLEPLSDMALQPHHGQFTCRGPGRPGELEPSIVVERRRWVGQGLREDLTVRNFSPAPLTASLRVELTADFADLFAVKLGHPAPHPVTVTAIGERWEASRSGGSAVTACVRALGGVADAGGITFEVAAAPHASWSGSFEVAASFDGGELPVRYPVGVPVLEEEPGAVPPTWLGTEPAVTTRSPALAQAVSRGSEDIAALEISDPDEPDLVLPAAGAPWFMALFGRDALLTSSMVLPFRPELALGSLRTLARHQGSRHDPPSEEQPGRIVHELRFGIDPRWSLGPSDRYFGSVDATPLFVVLLGQLLRCGGDRDAVEALLPAADRALEWVERWGDADGDGFVEYERLTPRGLLNQGWKDSGDGINFADGRLAEPPIALAEVQGYVFAARRARAGLARAVGDREAAGHWDEQARRLAERFDRHFWLDGPGWYAVGLDRDKRPIDALASNMGQCLWTGIVPGERVPSVARHLLSAPLFSGWGVRTLATTMGAYNPVSYHNGSVWPHDTALIARGLARCGLQREAATVAGALVEASAHFDGRLPEVFCGFDRAEHPRPVPYPTSCSPQAWAAAAPVCALGALLDLEGSAHEPSPPRPVVLPAGWAPVVAEGAVPGDRWLRATVDSAGTLHAECSSG